MSKRSRLGCEPYDQRREAVFNCLLSLQDGSGKTDQLAVLDAAIDVCANLMTWHKGFEGASAHFQEIAQRIQSRECL
jgi:hypothetical protein